MVEAQLQSGEDGGLGCIRVGVLRQCREVGRTALRSPEGLVRTMVQLLLQGLQLGLGLG